jgi:hypothetical protein
MLAKNQKLQVWEMLQRRPLLGNVKHQLPTATYEHRSWGTVGGGDTFVSQQYGDT